jgi:hypothetical protein
MRALTGISNFWRRNDVADMWPVLDLHSCLRGAGAVCLRHVALPSIAEELTDDAAPPISATGGKTPWEYMYSGLPVIADIVRSAFPVSEPILYRRACVLRSSNSMLGRASTTP